MESKTTYKPSEANEKAVRHFADFVGFNVVAALMMVEESRSNGKTLKYLEDEGGNKYFRSGIITNDGKRVLWNGKSFDLFKGSLLN